MLKEYYQENLNDLIEMISIQPVVRKEDPGLLDSSMKGLSPRSPTLTSKLEPGSFSGKVLPSIEMKLNLPVVLINPAILCPQAR